MARPQREEPAGAGRAGRPAGPARRSMTWCRWR